MDRRTGTSCMIALPLAIVSMATLLPLTLAGDTAGAMEAGAMIVSVSDQMVTHVTEVARQWSGGDIAMPAGGVDDAIMLPASREVVGGVVGDDVRHDGSTRLIWQHLDLPPPAAI